ncbi:MAG: winged helix-turn-helix transcriptional regulator [Rhizobiales bacterium]|nr:winged helix-turn-helix transcriptional regulator [Hyphomicrobiales bacterium]
MASNRDKNSEQTILLGLLDAVERGDVTQRSLSRELGIAVGLVNSYIKRCINKGLIKVQQTPPRRYGYFLTPKGFLEKSQLVAGYFVRSFDFFRRARASCEATLAKAAAAGHRRIGLLGAGELCEITVIVATELDVEIVAIVDGSISKPKLLRIPVFASVEAALANVDALMITSLSDPQKHYEAAIAVLDPQRVYVPSVLANTVTRSRPAAGAAKTRARK